MGSPEKMQHNGGLVMGIKFKNSLGGYDPEMVEKELALINDEFEKENQRLENELSREKEECKELQEELRLITEKVGAIKDTEFQIGNMLLKAHMCSTVSVYESIKRYKSLEKEKIKQLEDYTKRNKEISEEIDRLKESIQRIVNG